MPEPFKNFINEAVTSEMASHLVRVSPSFPSARFLELALSGLDALELKERVHHVSRALEQCLPADFSQAASALEASLAPARLDDDLSSLRTGPAGLAGWSVWAMTEWVARRGLHHPERSLEALREMTQRFSAEFAIRPFLQRDPEGTLSLLKRWLTDPSPHVRRWLSEGTRPRLPWGLRLDCFIKDPHACLPFLEALHDDPSEYVRRSVANHLNDISKDHPALAIEVCGRFLGKGAPGTPALVSHALRTLVKKGDPEALALLGFGGGKSVDLSSCQLDKARYRVGDTLELRFTLENRSRKVGRLVVDYAIHYLKANGTLSPKVFKGLKLELGAGERRELTLRHTLREVSTRVHRPGAHAVSLQVNGRLLAKLDFALQAAR